MNREHKKEYVKPEMTGVKKIHKTNLLGSSVEDSNNIIVFEG
jgi:hypothetical protein